MDNELQELFETRIDELEREVRRLKSIIANAAEEALTEDEIIRRF